MIGGDTIRKPGPIKAISETYNLVSDQWVKNDTISGEFMQVKNSEKPFKPIKGESNTHTLKLCSPLCALYEYKDCKFGVNGCGWAPCEDCANESKFMYRKGFDTILDRIYNDGRKRGYHDGLCDGIPECNRY